MASPGIFAPYSGASWVADRSSSPARSRCSARAPSRAATTMRGCPPSTRSTSARSWANGRSGRP